MASLRCRFVTLPVDQVLAQDEVVICMVTTRPPKTIVKPTALGPVANTDTKFADLWPISSLANRR